MFKKLLVAALALTIMIGLFSPALATKTISADQQLEQSLPRIDPGLRGSPGCTYEVNEYYYTNFYYIWGLPDAYGDDYFNMRFTNGVAFELEAVSFWFIKRATASGSNPVPNTDGGMGAVIYVWNTDTATPEGFPNLSSVIYSVVVNPIVWGNPYGYPASFTYVEVALPAMTAFTGEFNVGYSPIQNTSPGQRLYLISDNGSVGTLRSSEWWGLWGLMKDDWGVDVNFCIDAYKCATPDAACVSSADPLDQWPIWGHDYGRSSQSGISLGTDICGIANAWKYDIGLPILQLLRNSPLIVNDRVYVFYNDRVVCLNLLTGAPVWSSKTFTGAFPFNWGPAVFGLASNPAIEGGYLYLGTGGAVAGGPAGFIKVDATTGALAWGRGAGLGTDLPGTAGATTVSPPVVIGDKVFFGNQSGVLHALYTADGTTAYFTTLPTEAGLTAKMLGSLSSDGTNLFVGTASATATPVAAGRVYSFLPEATSFTQNWVYNQPAAVQLAYPGGFWSAPSYRNGNLFINSVATYNTGTGYCGYRQNLDPVTGIQKWYADVAMGSAWNAPAATICDPVTGGVTAVFANFLTAGYPGNSSARGIKAVNTFNSTIWTNPGDEGGYQNHVRAHASVTQDPWVFHGTIDPYGQNPLRPAGGFWKITNGITGAIFAQYAFSGLVNGTAIAHGSDGNDWIVVTTQIQRGPQGSSAAIGSGLVLAFRDMGPRPRLVVPKSYVEFPSTNDDELAPVQRTAIGAILNTGCVTMTFSAPLSDGALLAKVRTVSLSDQERAANLAASLIDRTVEDMSPFNEPVGNKSLLSSLVLNEEGEWYLPDTQVKPAIANSARLAVPDWVSWVTPVGGSGTVPAGGATDFTFQFDRTLMNKLGVNIFYVQISSSDPDYWVEDPAATPEAEIAYSMPYMYCATEIDTMRFGNIGVAWANNIGLLGDHYAVNEFAPTGSGDVMFQGSMFYMNDMPSAAWQPISGTGAWDPLIQGGFLYGYYASGTDCGGCVKNAPLPVEYTTNGGVSYSALIGDICTYAMVDSGQDMGYYWKQNGPSMGLLIKNREIGAYGPDFGAFKLTVQDITNRNATPISGLYYGSFIDWDVGSTDAGAGDAVKGYIYNYYGGAAYGQIGLPSKGSYWPDGVKTDPMYNGQILHSRDTYWNDEQLDSLYNWTHLYPEDVITILPPVVAGTDKSYQVAFGKANLGAFGQHTFGFATFGITSGFTGPTQVDNLRKFANKFAGFGRGDVDNNDVIDLRDVVRLQRYALALGPGPVPFKHLGDVNNNGAVDSADVTYLAAYFFTAGPPPKSTFKF